MERTNKKECPKCKSHNFYDTGSRMGDAVTIRPGEKIPEPRHPVYKCRDCGKLFIFGESRQN